MIKYIFLEVYYRSLYTILLILFLNTYKYFSQGFQLEFFSGLLTSNFQALDFNFNENLNYDYDDFHFDYKKQTIECNEQSLSMKTSLNNLFFLYKTSQNANQISIVDNVYNLLDENIIKKSAALNFSFSGDNDWYKSLKDINIVMSSLKIKTDFLALSKDLVPWPHFNSSYNLSNIGYFNPNIVSLNESKSWHYLFMSTVNYFHCLSVNQNILHSLIIYEIFLYSSLFILIHFLHFIKSGLFNYQHSKLIKLHLFFIIIAVLCNQQNILLYISSLEEIRLERLDSELKIQF